MKKLNIILMSIVTVAAASATMIEYVEDGYVIQAPKEITDLVQEAATIVGFYKPYEVVIPKKAGLQINPWNRFISSGVNPVTNNWLVIINPEWLSPLPHDQQIFLISRCFMQGNMGIVPPITTYIPWLFIIASWIMIYIMYRLFGRTRLNQQKPVVRFAVALGIMMVLNLTVINKVQSSILSHFYRKHDMAVNIATIEKTGDRAVAIQALQALADGLKQGIKDGEQSFVPFEPVFEKMIQGLNTQS